jgi:hypothetical protein
MAAVAVLLLALGLLEQGRTAPATLPHTGTSSPTWGAQRARLEPGLRQDPAPPRARVASGRTLVPADASQVMPWQGGI